MMKKGKCKCNQCKPKHKRQLCFQISIEDLRKYGKTSAEWYAINHPEVLKPVKPDSGDFPTICFTIQDNKERRTKKDEQ